MSVHYCGPRVACDDVASEHSAGYSLMSCEWELVHHQSHLYSFKNECLFVFQRHVHSTVNISVRAPYPSVMVCHLGRTRANRCRGKPSCASASGRPPKYVAIACVAISRSVGTPREALRQHTRLCRSPAPGSPTPPAHTPPNVMMVPATSKCKQSTLSFRL